MSGSQFVNRSAQEHLLYIQEKVNPILEALVTAVLLERPEDPAFFMLKWLCEQNKTLDGQDRVGGAQAEEIEAVRVEIKRLKEEKAELERNKSNKADVKASGIKQDDSNPDDDDDEEEEDDDDEEVDLPPPPKNRGPRQSVSAEAYGQWNVKKEFVAPVYEKTEEQKARIAKTLEPSFLFSGLEKEEMATVTLAFKERTCQPGDILIQQGADGESMFLLEEGTCDCIITRDGVDKVVKTCHNGDVFGELALLYNCPRAATVKATHASTLWELDRETFNRIVKEAAASKRNKYTDFLKKVPLFSNMEHYEIMTVADALKVEDYEEAGSTVIKQGDPGDKFYICMEGECEARKAFVAGAEPQKVKEYKAGDYFGELALINNDPRQATVCTTSADSKLLFMDRKTFKRLLGPIEDILRREASNYATSAQ